MNRIVYVNGKFLPESEASVSIFDRGFLFADAVYEVTSVLEGQLIDNEGHMIRLARSCQELSIPMPASPEEIEAIQKRLVKENHVVEGGVYLQVTRGSAGDRDFSFSDEMTPTLVMFTQSRALIDSPKVKTGINVISYEDMRWKRRDIKTTSLLPACLAKHVAHAAGAEDVWLIENGYVTEGGSSNAYIVTQEGTLVTRPLSQDILHGITRAALMKLAEQMALKIEERLFTIEEAYAAKEAFISSATTFVWPVVKIDDCVIDQGQPGPIALKLREIYIETARAQIQ